MLRQVCARWCCWCRCWCGGGVYSSRLILVVEQSVCLSVRVWQEKVDGVVPFRSLRVKIVVPSQQRRERGTDKAV